VKISPRHRHVRVLLAGSVKDPVDEAEARRVEADGVVQKPFEASLLLGAIKPLVETAAKDRGAPRTAPAAGKPAARKVPTVALIDPERVRAAVIVALDASLPAIIEEITEKVLIALNTR
jgi:DNA-binding response OmpR family regulator